MATKELRYLMDSIGYVFQNPDLLKTALTHRSVVKGHYPENHPNHPSQHHNERLEFLGDAVLELCIGAELFHRYPLAKEGQLSRMRANLVRGDSLVKLAMALNLGDYLLLGQGERHSGGHRRASILEDAMEALIGALYLDGGLEVAQRCVLKWFDEILKSFDPHREGIPSIHTIDAKSRLQEYLQGLGHATPNYILTKTEGLAHEQDFFVACEVPELNISGEGVARNRKSAEQNAASSVLNKIVEANPHAKL
jgi:ribonuclease-3